jgi:hypothetical protein
MKKRFVKKMAKRARVRLMRHEGFGNLHNELTTDYCVWANKLYKIMGFELNIEPLCRILPVNFDSVCR